MTVDGETITIDRTAPALVRNIFTDGETITIDTTSTEIRTLVVDGKTITIDRSEEASVISILNQLFTRETTNIFNKDTAVDNTGGSDEWNDYLQSAPIAVVGGESYNQNNGDAFISEYDEGSTTPDHLTLQSGSLVDYSNRLWFDDSSSVRYSALEDIAHDRDFSISFNWISGSNTSDIAYLIANAVSGTNRFTLGTSSGGKLNAMFYTGSYIDQTTISYEPETFYSVTVVNSASGLVITLNGVDSGSFSGFQYRSTNGYLSVGGSHSGTVSLDSGSIWDVKVYSDSTFGTLAFSTVGEGITASGWVDSVGGKTATIIGSPSVGPVELDKDYSNLMAFAGSQSVRYEDLEELGHDRDFSISFNWISGDNTSDLAYLIGNAINNTNKFTLGISSGSKLNAMHYNGSYINETTISYEPNTLYFVTVINSNTGLVINLNGVNSGSFSGSRFRSSNVSLSIGGSHSGGAAIDSGSIWDVKVYSDTTFSNLVFSTAGLGITSSDWADSFGGKTATIIGSPSTIGASTGNVSTGLAGAITLQDTTTSAVLMAPSVERDTLMFKKGSDNPSSYESYGTITESFANHSLLMVSYGDSLTAQETWQDTVTSALNLGHVQLGIGGRRVTGLTGLAAQDSIDTVTFTTDLIVAMGGTNDWVGSVPIGNTNSVDINDFYGALNIMLDRLELRCAQAQIILMTPPYSEDKPPFRFTGFTDDITNGLGLTLSDYADAIKAVATARGLPVVDNYNNSWDSSNITTYMKDDGNYIHPNEAGGEIIGNNLIQVISEI